LRKLMCVNRLLECKVHAWRWLWESNRSKK
jgi:hypothetical protein